jgi:hypothetical protein
MGRPRGSSNLIELSQDGVFGNTYLLRLNGEETTKSAFKDSPLSFCASGHDGELDGSKRDFDTISTFSCFNITSNISHFEDIDKFGWFGGYVNWCRLSLCSRTYGLIQLGNRQPELAELDRPLKKVGEGSNQDVIASSISIYEHFKYLIGPASTAKLARMIETVTYSESLQEFLIELVLAQGWEEFFRRVGEVATGYIQSSQNPEAGISAGNAYAYMPFFEVRWTWLIMPLLLVLTSILFLICTVFQSRRKPYLFKNSIVASILYGLEGWRAGELQMTPGNRETERDLERRANNMKAKLVSDGDGNLRFVWER